MIDKIKAVTNPLTIIAIFAALAEVAGTTALSLVSQNLQVVFVWFVMLFPTLIVVLFFLTLNFNSKVLYAPSDFKDEDNYLHAMYGVGKLKGNIDLIDKQFDNAKLEIFKEIESKISSTNDENFRNIKDLVSSQLSLVKKEIRSTKEAAVDTLSFNKNPNATILGQQILNLLKNYSFPISIDEICSSLGRSRASIQKNLVWLEEDGCVISVENNQGERAYSFSKNVY
ncbi:helix-turn-helix domain-containing protein (plasmid) [Pseudomonas luteola]|uniref:helix-turn-helix domain-containing protein n=1 Tax=Pseudomonas luteola TaxID=47886 RepID=UPI00388D5E51